MIPFLRDNNTPAQLPTFFGNVVIDPSSFSGDLSTETLPQTESTKEYSWSRGLGIEYSLIKTRSSRKKLQSSTSSSFVTDPSTSDSGALRAVKALARAK
jgi:hypothetical protein